MLYAVGLASLLAFAPKSCTRADDDRPHSSDSSVDTSTPSMAVAPAPAPPPASSSASPPPSNADTKEYCKKMYGKAYMLCGREDHDCKFLAADKRQRCEKTGRWP
jgi:hypothetical protein